MLSGEGQAADQLILKQQPNNQSHGRTTKPGNDRQHRTRIQPETRDAVRERLFGRLNGHTAEAERKSESEQQPMHADGIAHSLILRERSN
jgi:hypothetical protein